MPRAFEPRAYQLDAIAHIEECPRGNLWAGMGMGKTTAALTAVSRMQLEGTLREPVLVLGPRRVIEDTWPGELGKWAHLQGLEMATILGTPNQRAEALKRDVPLFGINYDNLPWLVDHLGDRWPFGMVIADESTRIKGMRIGGSIGVRAKALAKVAHKNTRRWVNLTGTPSPNGLVDLWGQQWFVDAGARLGRTYTAYLDRWFRKPARGTTYSKPIPLNEFAEADIHSRLRDVTLSLRSEDYFALEEPVRRTIQVRLPDRAMAQYKMMQRDFFAEIEGHEIDAGTAAVKSQKLLQMASGAVYLVPGEPQWVEVHDAKIQALESLVSELAGAPLLVSYCWRHDLERLRKAFPKARSIDEKGAISAWNKGDIPILLAHPASAGHGLNLQDGGHHIAYFSSDWNLEHHDQILERIGPVRQLQAGYSRNVHVFYIVAKGTIDELVPLRLIEKRNTQDLLTLAMTKARKGEDYA
jgi:SNF2 family DNA or RNA helicase